MPKAIFWKCIELCWLAVITPKKIAFILHLTTVFPSENKQTLGGRKIIGTSLVERVAILVYAVSGRFLITGCGEELCERIAVVPDDTRNTMVIGCIVRRIPNEISLAVKIGTFQRDTVS